VSQPGWYPDPGGQPAAFRYWDGRAWSAATTNNPQAAPPPGAQPQQPPRPFQPAAPASVTYGSTPYGSTPYGSTPYGTNPSQPNVPQQKKKRTGWWIGAGVLALVVVLVAFFGIRALVGTGGLLNNDPGGKGTTNLCPASSSEAPSPVPRSTDGRMHGGQMSYPQLGAPWQPPRTDSRVPFGRNVASQDVPVQQDYDGRGASWVASVLIGELVAGDGFFSPEEGSKVVVKCIEGTFYGNNQVTPHDTKNKAMKVDGKDAWIVESHLTFDIKGLTTKGELLIVVIVATSAASSSIYYASIPDTTPELVKPAQDLISQLKVDK